MSGGLKWLTYLVGFLALAVALWMGIRLVGGAPGGAEVPDALVGLMEDVADGAALEIVRFEADAADPIEIAAAESGGEAWVVNGLPADSAGAARLWQALADMEVGDLVARNPTNHERMGIADGSATRMTVSGEGFEDTIILGDAGPRFGTTYARVPGEDEVYLLLADLSSHASRGLDAWRSKRMVAVDTASVGRIEVERDGEIYALARGDSAWTFSDGAEIDDLALRNILSELRDLQGTGFLQPGDSIAALESGGSVTAYGSDGRVLAAIEIGSGSGDRWGTTGSDTTLYRLSSFFF